MKLQSIKDVKGLRGKRVLVRVDFNVPVRDGKVIDDFKIKKLLPTIEFLKDKRAKIILISHIGREGESLEPVAQYLNKYIENTFVRGSEIKDVVEHMKEGEVIVLENLRKHSEEKKNNETFAKWLAELADVYVNEAFAVNHREHASIVSVPKYLPSYTGFQLEAEIEHLEKVLTNPDRPFLFILGGVKFETKIPLIEKFLQIADFVFIGGALANNFFKEQGFEVGQSVVDSKDFGLKGLLGNRKLILPVDVVVKKNSEAVTKKPNEVAPDEMIVDIGLESLKVLRKHIHRSEFILWNGPLGYYDHGFGEATEELVKTLALSKAEAVIGGGDTVALVSKLNLENKFSFVSTGGGAMLEFLEKGTLPGIEALKGK